MRTSQRQLGGKMRGSSKEEEEARDRQVDETDNEGKKEGKNFTEDMKRGTKRHHHVVGEAKS